jgi:hypothetical protein
MSAVTLNDENKAKLDKWMSGEKSPTFNQLEKFSAETRIPLGYFSLKFHRQRSVNFSNTEQ